MKPGREVRERQACLGLSLGASRGHIQRAKECDTISWQKQKMVLYFPRWSDRRRQWASAKKGVEQIAEFQDILRER
jgi:hypothetical protein